MPASTTSHELDVSSKPLENGWGDSTSKRPYIRTYPALCALDNTTAPSCDVVNAPSYDRHNFDHEEGLSPWLRVSGGAGSSRHDIATIPFMIPSSRGGITSLFVRCASTEPSGL